MDAIVFKLNVTDLIFEGSGSRIQYLERSGLIKHRKYLASKNLRNVLRYSFLPVVKTLKGEVVISMMHLLLSFIAKPCSRSPRPDCHSDSRARKQISLKPSILRISCRRFLNALASAMFLFSVTSRFESLMLGPKSKVDVVPSLRKSRPKGLLLTRA